MSHTSEINNNGRGFVVRYELLGIIAMMMVQSLGGIWWASSMNTNMDNVKDELSSIKVRIENSTTDRYRGADAQKDFTNVYTRISANENRILKLEDRVTSYRSNIIKE